LKRRLKIVVRPSYVETAIQKISIRKSEYNHDEFMDDPTECRVVLFKRQGLRWTFLAANGFLEKTLALDHVEHSSYNISSES